MILTHLLLVKLVIIQLARAAFDINANQTCGKTKSCMSKPAVCDPLTNCVYFVSYDLDPSRKWINFDLLADLSDDSSDQYAAVGFSKDQLMGDDTVTFCVRYKRSVSALFGLAYNPGRSTTIIKDDAIRNDVKVTESGRIGTKFWCKISRRIEPTMKDSRVWPLNDKYYLLMASGKYTDGGFSIHQMGKGSTRFPFVSGDAVNPMELYGAARNAESNEASCVTPQAAISLVRAHGIMMVLGWWLFMAMGMLSARYLRSLWPSKRLVGNAIWFNLHRGFNATGLALVAAAFICIFICNCGLWTNSATSYDHSVLGMTASVCAFVQPILALVRCDKDNAKRPIFNWVHRFVGVVAFCCASTAIWLATYFRVGLNTVDEYGRAPRGMMIFYFVAVVATVLCLEVLVTLFERLKIFNKTTTHVAPNQFKIETPETAHQKSTGLWNLLRLAILAFFFIIALAVVITLACFIGLHNYDGNE